MPKALLIEDINGVRKTVAMMLKSLGYEVTEASGGLEGQKLGQTGEFDLILTDILMPDADGAEVITNLKQSPNFRSKIIAMSGGGSQVPVDTALQVASLHADNVLRKPFDLDELEAVIKEISAVQEAS